MRLTFVLLLVIVTESLGNELSRCCAGGTRHFKTSNTCSNIKSEGSSTTCTRSASICCLRSLIDSSCDDGTDVAKREDVCRLSINVLGGGIKKECCDCCLLAKELVSRNEPCVAPTGFSAMCLRSFNKCCAGSPVVFPSIGDEKQLVEPTLLNIGDRCTVSTCEHLCHDRGGETVECSCKAGYDLAPDGVSCVDIDECRQLMDDCLESQRCLNTPGSFKCIRTLSCGTGYAMDSTTEECIDVDECNLGSHDCGALYQCRNTQGSYRCDPKKCGDGELQNPETGECTSIQCPAGYLPKHGMCNDIDECQVEDRCGPAEECVNTPGSYRCQQKGNLCAYGYDVNKATGFCEDVNECLSDLCDGMECINLPGSYKCKCAIGFEFNDVRKKCEDIDECAKFAGHVCDLSAECINTIGSFECKCNKGFHLAPGGRRCEDVNECLTGEAKCEQKCVNIPGSYQCICDRGFALGPDGVHCEDIDECAVWAGSGNDLCMGGCVNTKGSYLCQCPSGYQIQADGRTCVDIDECKQGECAGDNRVCVNTLGSFKCHTIQCPNNYVHDSLNKNRCNRVAGTCGLPEACSKMPLFISWQFISLARAVPFSSQRPSITLFKVTAPNQPDTHVQFELQLKRVTTDRPGVLPAIRANFLLQKGEKRNSAVVTLRDSLDGPQTVELELLLRVSKFGKSLNTYVASLVVDVSAHKRHNHVNPPLIRA